MIQSPEQTEPHTQKAGSDEWERRVRFSSDLLRPSKTQGATVRGSTSADDIVRAHGMPVHAAFIIIGRDSSCSCTRTARRRTAARTFDDSVTSTVTLLPDAVVERSRPRECSCNCILLAGCL